ncbi:MAG: hypothetical protein IPP34_08035 [Bacteroidetes bacterium]|nr:hypothetical protein [Bacteroidota bacterium]
MIIEDAAAPGAIAKDFHGFLLPLRHLLVLMRKRTNQFSLFKRNSALQSLLLELIQVI